MRIQFGSAHAIATLFALSTTQLLAGCATSGSQSVSQPTVFSRAPDAVGALQRSNFKEAEALARETLEREPNNTQARAVRALTRYKNIGHDLSTDLRTLAGGMAFASSFNTRYLTWSLGEALKGLDAVDKDLAHIEAVEDFELELCLACWEVDWNRSGRVDANDRRLFEVERDSAGERIEEGDPRRRPTFRYDAGDVHWARAMVAFQRAGMHIVQAYDLSEVAEVPFLMRGFSDERLTQITLRLESPEHIAEVKRLLLLGIAQADASRKAYLAETDDTREWVPNPDQKSHPLPLPVDAVLYETWAGVLADLRDLIEGKTGFHVTEIAQLGDNQWQDPPQGYINVATLLDNPGDITINFGHAKALDRDRTKQNVERILRDIFGAAFVTDMSATPLLSRMRRMRDEVSRGEESFERKLRYLLWLN